MSDPRTPSRAERERLRALAEQARQAELGWTRLCAMPDTLFDQRIYDEAARKHDRTKAALWDACSPSVVLSLLAALDEGEQRATAFGVDQESSTARTEAPARRVR